MCCGLWRYDLWLYRAFFSVLGVIDFCAQLDASDLSTLSGIEQLTTLRELRASHCPLLIDIEGTEKLTLSTLAVSGTLKSWTTIGHECCRSGGGWNFFGLEWSGVERQLSQTFCPSPQLDACPLPLYDIADETRYDAGRVVQCCRQHRQLAQLAVLEWALALASLRLPPYVALHIFESLQERAVPSYRLYKQYGVHCKRRVGERRLHCPSTAVPDTFDEDYFHVCVEERTHVQNIRVMISVASAHRRVTD